MQDVLRFRQSERRFLSPHIRCGLIFCVRL